MYSRRQLGASWVWLRIVLGGEAICNETSRVQDCERPGRLCMKPAGFCELLNFKMTELKLPLDKTRQLAEASNHKLIPLVRRGPFNHSLCVTCGHRVYVMSHDH